VGVHSPHLWTLEYNHQFPSLNDWEIDFMERESVKHADYVWFPSRYIEKWVQERWNIKIDRKFIAPLPLCVEIFCKKPDDNIIHTSKKKKLIFFGRLEKRKGLDLFVEALSKLVNHKSREYVDKIIFLGKDVPWNKSGLFASHYILQNSKSWPWEVEIISNLDRNDAIELLKSDDSSIVVIPSVAETACYCVYECLLLNKIFIASNSGAIPEVVSKEYHDKYLFDLDSKSLVKKLDEIITRNTFDLPKASFDFDDIESMWLNIHNKLINRVNYQNINIKCKNAKPFVSVCLVHHDRPHYLANAIDSLLKQTYKNFEVILVDDGSESQDSLDFLDKIDSLFRKKGWKIILQENKYLGAARNCAARYASGEYLLFMDDDNYAKPYELEIFVRAAISSDADILTCVVDKFYSLEDILNDCPVSRYLPLGNVTLLNVITNLLGDANMFVKRSVFENLGGFKEVKKITFEDWEFLTRASLKGYKIYVVPEPLFWYRVHSSSMLHTTDRYLNHRFRLNALFENINPELYKMMILALNSVNNG